MDNASTPTPALPRSAGEGEGEGEGWGPRFLERSNLFEPLRPAGYKLNLISWPALADYAKLLADTPVFTRGGKPLRCVPQGPRPGNFAEKYEPRIYLKGELQVRAENWHDLLNLLVWLTFPKAKAALNERHYFALREQQARGLQNRTPVQDALTLFDEGGVVIACSNDELARLLKDFEWKTLFWENRREVISGMKFMLFGHAIYEKSLQPFSGITGKGIVFDVKPDFFSMPLAAQLAVLDEKLCGYICGPKTFQSTRELAPVPILGVPGWSAVNERESYYDDINYFRPGRTREQTI